MAVTTLSNVWWTRAQLVLGLAEVSMRLRVCELRVGEQAGRDMRLEGSSS